MAKNKEPALGSRLVIGAIAGFVATMAMTAAMRRLHKQLPEKERYPLTPREITDAVLDPPSPISPDITLVAHFAYGAGCGALIAAADPRIGRVSGAFAGGAVWLTSYMGWIPALDVLKSATGHPMRRNAVMLAAHLAWGWSTAEGIRELTEARATIFADGPHKDVPDAA
ncbi:MAG TPA: hypothetical protein VLK25_03790 [Allosphingosinicella sp.]|nr:hypothetical protein [Allosphingosinicella sp.]